tara:strand:- start:2214 stop:3116 length:903 start_codon:yes stop_codon:yes gene_type:complete
MNKELLVSKFNIIKTLNTNMVELFKVIKENICILDNKYNILITNKNITETGFLYVLDSLHFQKKNLEFDLDYFKKSYNNILYRMYGDYYKLYKDLTKYTEQNKINIKMKNIEKFKDLEKTNIDFKIIIDINFDIIEILLILNDNNLKNKYNNKELFNLLNTGLNINSLVNIIQYNDNNLENNITLFNDNLISYYNYHNKYISNTFIYVTDLSNMLNDIIKNKNEVNDENINENENENEYLNENINISDISHNICIIDRDIKLLIENVDSKVNNENTTINNYIKSHDYQLEYNIKNNCIIL